MKMLGLDSLSDTLWKNFWRRKFEMVRDIMTYKTLIKIRVLGGRTLWKNFWRRKFEKVNWESVWDILKFLQFRKAYRMLIKIRVLGSEILYSREF